MSRISSTFAQLGQSQRTALTAYITAGDPSLEHTLPGMHALVQGGADILELGIPFSDPEADGPTIQAASERALKTETSLIDVLGVVAAFRESDDKTPLILMGYLNSIEKMGYESFARRANEAGLDGLIMVNLPPEEAELLCSHLEKYDIDIIFLVAPTSTDERIEKIARVARGFIYYVSLKGTTGADHLDIESVRKNVTRIRAFSDLPIQVGFGIKDGATAAQVASCADGVVVGSALVEIMAGRSENILSGLEALSRQLRDAIDSSDA